MDYSNYFLKDNPFRLTPTIKSEEIIWAGFEDLKKKIESRIELNIRTTPSKIVLNWGRYGSGKTHAANYFSKTNRLEEICKRLDSSPVKSVKVTLPRTSKDPVQAFLRSFLGQVSIESIIDDFKRLQNINPDILEILRDISNDHEIYRLFELILSNDFGEKDNKAAVTNYFYGDKTRTTLKILDLPLGLQDDEQIVNLLSTYINALTFNKKLFSSIILWVDEFEDIDTISKTGQDRITSFLRQLIDKTPNNLLIFLNFTPKSFFSVEDLSVILGDALKSRISTQITFDIPKDEDAIHFIDMLINHSINRMPGQIPDKFFPFAESAIRYVLMNIGPLSARRINEVFSLILELAIIHDICQINKEFIDRIKEEITDWGGKK